MTTREQLATALNTIRVRLEQLGDESDSQKKTIFEQELRCLSGVHEHRWLFPAEQQDICFILLGQPFLLLSLVDAKINLLLNTEGELTIMTEDQLDWDSLGGSEGYVAQAITALGHQLANLTL